MRWTLLFVALCGVAVLLWWLTVGPAPPVPERPMPADSETEIARGGSCGLRVRVHRDGEPAAARIEVRALVRGLTDHPSLNAFPLSPGPLVAEGQAGADGRARIDGLTPGEYVVSGRTEDGASGRTRTGAGPEGTSTGVFLRLDGGDETLAGRAVHADGRPFSGYAFADTSFPRFPPRGAVIGPARTDDEGRFRIEHLPAKEIAVRFLEPGGFRSEFAPVKLPADGERLFVVDGDLEECRGRVVADDDGRALPGVEVTASGAHAGRVFVSLALSDGEGRFNFRLPGPRGHVRLEREGFAKASASVKEGEKLVVRMKRLGAVAGRVVSKADGQPLPEVPVFGPRLERAVTNGEGRFWLALPPGKSAIHALGSGWVVDDPVPVVIEQGGIAEVTLEAIRAGRVEGVVRNADGAAAAGVPVYLGHGTPTKLPSRLFLHQELTTTVSGPDGSFTFECLVPDLRLRITARPQNTPPGRAEPFTAAPGETIHIEITLPEHRWLPVRVVEEGTGAPIEGVDLSASQEGGYRSPGVETGADGTARVGPLMPGPLTLSVFHREYVDFESDGGRAVPDPGPTPEELRIEILRVFPLTGRILKPDGTPFSGGGFMLCQVGEKVSLVRGHHLDRVGPEGRFARGLLAEGSYDLVLFARYAVDARFVARWTVQAGQEDLELVIDPTQAEREEPPVILQLRAPDGGTALGRVRLLAKGKKPRHYGRLSGGRYVLDRRHATPGETVWIAVENAETAEGAPLGGVFLGPVVLAEGETPIPLPPEITIEGRVVGPDGNGIEGVQVGAAPDLSPSFPDDFTIPPEAPPTTDAEGRFRIGRLAERPHFLVVELPDGYAVRPPPRVNAGARRVEIFLEPAALAEIRIVDPDGKAVPKARYSWVHPDSARIRRTGLADEQGVVAIPGLDAGARYSLSLEAPRSRTDLAPILVSDWKPASGTFTLPAGAPVAGAVRSKSGLGFRAHVWWKDSRGRWRSVKSSIDGRFRIVALLGSQVTLCASPIRRPARESAGPEVATQAGAENVVLRLPKE